MTTEQPEAPVQNTPRRRGPKNFPVLPFEEVLILPKTIREEGVSEQMRRETLFNKLDRAPESRQSRNLVTVSSRYGLTAGSYHADDITITEIGAKIAADSYLSADTRKLIFKQAIEKFAPFDQLYKKLIGKRVPGDDVLADELDQVGVDTADRQQAASVFMSNARYIGLVQEVDGSDQFISIDQVLEETSSPTEKTPPVTDIPSPSLGSSPLTPPAEPPGPAKPSLHIDVQIHIDSSASADQIDQIFSSMAKHLYSRDGQPGDGS